MSDVYIICSNISQCVDIQFIIFNFSNYNQAKYVLSLSLQWLLFNYSEIDTFQWYIQLYFNDLNLITKISRILIYFSNTNAFTFKLYFYINIYDPNFVKTVI